ncbi:MAG: LysR family transcriptional regulator [Paracoccaceae bacterium]
MSERLEIDALRALLAIAKHGGVTRAAEYLGLSQSAVSHKMRRLEQALDCNLLARRRGGPLLTESGERLKNYAHRLIDLHDEALADLGKKPLSGTIRLGMTEDTTTSDIARIVGRFSTLCPAVCVRIRASQSLNVQAWLKAGELDIAVMQVFKEEVLENDLVLFTDSLHWVKSPDFALDLSRRLPFLSFDSNCFYRQWGSGDGQLEDYRFETVLECPSAAGIQSAVRSGLGVALLNGMHLSQGIEVIEGVFPPPPDITFVVRTHAKSRTAPVKALIEEITREFRASTPKQAAE